nr:ABC transporter permease [Pseudomonadota bacterium]
MKITRTFITALEALSRNKLRSILTALGIIIGVASVIVMIEIGQGSSLAIQKTIESMGANNLIVLPGTAASGGVSFGAGSVLTLTAEDSEAILRENFPINGAAPVVRSRSQIIYKDKNWVPFYIYGTTPAFLDVRDWN